MTNKQKFIEKANTKYSEKFDYSKFNYINAKTKSTITCPVHGDFEQNPDKHLTSKYGCPECALLGRTQVAKQAKRKGFKPLKYTWEDMLVRLTNKFPNLSFTCENYVGVYSKVTLSCPEHGEHVTEPHTLTHKNVKYGCPQCGKAKVIESKTGSFQDFVDQANKLYNNKYTYSCETYVNKKSKVAITCDIHGTFTKSAQKHLSGQACEKCTTDSLVLAGRLPGGYCETIFSRSDELKNKLGILYYFKIGEVYKIGITINLKQRVNALKSKSSTSVEVIDTLSTTLYEAYKLEQTILETYAEYRTRTEASTELFTKDVLEGKILK